MAIGDYGNNNGGNNNSTNKTFDPTYYSRMRFKNAESGMSLGFSFRSGLMIIDMSVLQNQNGFKYDTLESIYISPTKAKLFAEEIKKFKEYLNEGNIIPGKAFGINAGMGEKVSYIGIHADESKIIYITIGKINGNGEILESATMSLNKEYHFALEWNDIQTMDLTKAYNDDVELNQIIDVMEDFSRYMSGALAYSVADLTRYDYNRMMKKLDPIFDKLGIERRSEGGNNYSGGSRTNNFLDNANRTSTSTSIDDIDNMLL